MANALIVRKSHLPGRRDTFRAAQYVRMSTDKQRYSIQNQAAVIAAYAHAHGLQIVKTYQDEGESGLRIKNRAGLRQLIADVSSGDAEFSHVLVYDVSRWGRFQDTDESAHYEFVCKQAGVQVAYCAEQFDNDGSMLSSIVKNLKRVMAAEYSRELSAKVHAGQSRIVKLGFRHGAPIAYAFRRELVDQNQRPKAILQKGEHKALITDRVRVALGAADEVSIVQWIFEQCLSLKPDTAIASELNRRKVPAPTGRVWNRGIVARILQNENYIGHLIYNRQSRKLGGAKVDNPEDHWVRGENCVEPIVPAEVFQRTQKRIEDRRVEISEDEMLIRLRRTLHKKGRLSPAIIDNTSGLPGIHTYIRHFGSVRNVYRLIGYKSERDYSFIDAAARWGEVTVKLAGELGSILERAGRRVEIGESGDELCIDQTIRILLRVAGAYPKPGLLTQWRVPSINRPSSQYIVAIRLSDDNQSLLDYVVLSSRAVVRKYTGGYLRLTDLACERLGFQRANSVKALARRLGARK